MWYPLFSLILCALVMSSAGSATAQRPEPQISFAREMKPHSYYVEQAKLWWLELEKDSTSETTWYNYFRASRNAQGTADWKTDFVKESPYLRSGEDILALMEKRIPNTATYYFLSYLNNGVGLENGDKLLRAYQMNPNLEGIHSSLITYAVCSLDTSLRKEVNRSWSKLNYISPNLLNYGYNVLMSMEPNAVLLTENDNDTYPLWMLQDAMNVRPDVKVINIDFLLLPSYRTAIFAQLGIDSLTLPGIDQNEYRVNWKTVVHHIISNYHTTALYLGMTLSPDLYEADSAKLSVAGLAYRVGGKASDLSAKNRNLFEHVFLLDSLTRSFYVDGNEANVVMQNINYLNFLKPLFDDYTRHKKLEAAKRVKSIAFAVVERANRPEWTAQVAKEFR